MDTGIPFVVFANCIIVKGHQRASICDLQRGSIHLIPLDLSNILIQYNKQSIDSIFRNYDKENNEILMEYFNYLSEHEIIFQTLTPELFPDIATKYEINSAIHNCIMHIDLMNNLNIGKIVSDLIDLDCNFLEILIKNQINYLNELDIILDEFENSTITAIKLIIKINNTISDLDLKKFCDRNKRVVELIIYDTKNEDILFSDSLHTKIELYSEKIVAPLCCGKISQKYFAVNLEVYTESLHHNTCLNRKISIDTEGNIKNCPSMKQSFGNIKDTTLEEATNKPGFKKYWNITKDEVTKCKDCEFRHVCTDCRAYLENPEDIYSAPLKCGYDPYTCEWEEWSTNPLKQKSIDYYGMREILINE